ncbi:glutamate cyclase domain-containing protein [Microbulbifer hydrolyticus]|uniref:DUF4392 domain-containing protein n=1 Tax=Microbulbifer hydrolyticus TaxID=48074 RepID=A0A6P1T7P5_9GAMM|nr:glutamate cyclase domain-containing protein [Microbulbifer hydrolyticus]MBB5210771.1 hypothetical protein [Microbulbifer hydrolyticus]QHQ38788.1 DUF4392 domain-containing protein [Microbulbifer hydrolyticus]
MDNLVLDRFHRADTMHLSAQLESLMVACNLRGMGTIRDSGYRGYLQSAVETLLRDRQRVAIVSGFPMGNSFETDGPAGAIALAHGLRKIGSKVALLGITEYAQAMAKALPQAVPDGEGLAASIFAVDPKNTAAQLKAFSVDFRPTLVIFIEVPGSGSDGRYRNMRFEDISASTLEWELLLRAVECPTLAIADGGNELGMGMLRCRLEDMPIACAHASTDELVIADVSNWGAYALLAQASACVRRPLLDGFSLAQCLQALVMEGVVDGVTGAVTATEDGLPLSRSLSFIEGVKALSHPFCVSEIESPAVSQDPLAEALA